MKMKLFLFNEYFHGITIFKNDKFLKEIKISSIPRPTILQRIIFF